MKKFTKITTASMLGALIIGAATGCGSSYDLVMWTGFGSSYTKAVQSIVDTYAEQSGVSIDHQGQGSYDNIQSNMNNSVSTATYPNIANGYPDHFAGYIKSSIQVELDPYIEMYNEEYGVDLLSDYYPQYMTENQTLKYDASGKAYTMGLPFNKSTEIMAYNAQFFAYCQFVDPTITHVPATWDDWANDGPKMYKVMEKLFGNKLVAVGEEGSDNLTDWQIIGADDEVPSGKILVMDCSNVSAEQFRLLSWDSADNMFITVVRQWGGTYTSYTSEDAKKYQHGWAEFYSGDSKATTKAAMEYFKKLYDDKIFGLPSTVSDDSYSSTAFKNYKVMFTICSTGGLSYNIQEGLRVKFAPIPYKDADHKYVISQGTSLAVFDQGTEEDKYKAFKAIVAFTTGDLQAQFAAETGYFPASKSATSNAAYQAILNADDSSLSQTKLAYKESAVLNENVYMNDESKWIKFVDPGFVGSSGIREEVETIMAIVFAGQKSIDDIMAESYTRLKGYVH